MKIKIKSGVLHDVSLWAKPVPSYMQIEPPEPEKDPWMWTHQGVDVILPEVVDASEENRESDYADLYLSDGTIIGYVDCREYDIL